MTKYPVCMIVSSFYLIVAGTIYAIFDFALSFSFMPSKISNTKRKITWISSGIGHGSPAAGPQLTTRLWAVQNLAIWSSGQACTHLHLDKQGVNVHAPFVPMRTLAHCSCVTIPRKLPQAGKVGELWHRKPQQMTSYEHLCKVHFNHPIAMHIAEINASFVQNSTIQCTTIQSNAYGLLNLHKYMEGMQLWTLYTRSTQVF